MAREHMFGYGTGKVSGAKQARIERVAERHGAMFTAPNLPGRGPCFWFATTTVVPPFNERVEREVMSALEHHGLLPISDGGDPPEAD